MNLIVAVDNNWAIGSKNELLIRIPNDHKHFREETTGKVVVLGRKTLETFPQGMPLKNRINIILSKDPNYQVKDAIVVHSIEELLEELKKFPQIKEVRGRGLLVGVEFTKPIANEVKHLAVENRLLITAVRPNVIRMAPPLIVTKEQCDKAVQILIKCVSKAAEEADA